ncbi:hypothetical protein M7I_6501 [Glarea lozoyensis 74030]|uniref:Uncharacterized protein n=1 Tax=Glarea lozoyensis (strain ATCC 74030 / MF5533) TaxID=1104152 RepID=H0EUR2_GLAL7|nr:hypothetical protein M7I_6501 [Glarea lozoyensis 74030]
MDFTISETLVMRIAGSKFGFGLVPMLRWHYEHLVKHVRPFERYKRNGK